MSSRLALIREALRILDGEVPDELVVEGDGWSLIDPESVRRDSGLEATTVVEVPLPPGRAPVVSLLDAMHDALDAAIDEGWLLEAEPESSHETPEERAFFEAGDAMAHAMHQVGGMPDYEENSPAFWRKFWARSA